MGLFKSALAMGKILSISLLICFVQGLKLTPQSSSPSFSTPNMDHTPRTPVVVLEGENAALTCVVKNLGKGSVLWKKWENGKVGYKILAASDKIVTSDPRFKIIHDEGGDVWVLAIGASQTSDSGLYICEVNSIPAVQSFHNLTVLSLNILAPSSKSGENSHTHSTNYDSDFGISSFGDYAFSYKGRGTVENHNYTDCCLKYNVSKDCLGFCTLKTILDGSTGEPTQCENDFPQIVRCMADGRDHLPCCIREQVPDICQDLCRGEYTLVTDNVKTHFSCPLHIERTLSCIADGVEILPSEPLDIETQATSPTSINVSWSIPVRNGDTLTEYVVNITTLRKFDAPVMGLGYGQEDSEFYDEILGRNKDANVKKEKESTTENSVDHSGDSYVQAHAFSRRNLTTMASPPSTSHYEDNAEDKVEVKMMQIKVHSDLTSTVINNLQPFTMYEISVRAFNIHGGSLPSVKIRTLTLAPGVTIPTTATNSTPTLPDIKSCCESQGILTPTCVTKLCDPKGVDDLDIPDLMICAVHSSAAFTCMANGNDHTPCCRERGIPEPCTEFCSGNFSARLDYHYFKCLKYMGIYKSCLMESYGVLPSAPLSVRVSNVNQDFAIVHWAKPKDLGDSVTGYSLLFRPLSTYEDVGYRVAQNVQPPYILENLYSNAEYEVYVQANNEHGMSKPSQRVVFRTTSAQEISAELEEETNNYNETGCCEKAGLSSLCMPLCSYDASMSDIRLLALSCATEFHTILRCAAGGRDHRNCCERRGVIDSCLGVCSARLPDSLLTMADNCLPFIGNIVQCFEEGTDILPGPVEEFHAGFITDSSIALSWEAPPTSNVTYYEVFYQIADPSLGRDLSATATQSSLNVTNTAVEVSNLSTNSIYEFWVVGHNQHGSSVPSSMIKANISAANFNGSKIAGVTSAPHSLVIGSHSASWVQIVWQPPVFIHPEDKLVYRVYYRAMNETKPIMNQTLVNTITLESLKPNTQYIVFVTGFTEKGESQPSETLIAWTDPAHSPFVEPPRIQPSNGLIEGKSMTVFCVALGDPTPTISLYINGKLIKQQTSRHLTQLVQNITRDMDIVSCFAENGYGTPMQAARRIQVSHAPTVQGSDINFGTIGTSTTLECNVIAFPEPKVAFYKAVSGSTTNRVPIIDGGKYKLNLTGPTILEETKYTYKLKILNLSESDSGDYICSADNHFGESTKILNLRTRVIKNESLNVSACCARENVAPGCMDACNMYLDIDSVIDNPECLPEFNKLMRCAADGRDHRVCCIGKSVARDCLDACQGYPVQSGADLCAFQYTKSILNCFHENRDLIPGPPENVNYKVISENEVLISWDPPTKNPGTAMLYKLLWRKVGEKRSEKIDTQETNAHVLKLQPGINYEAVVKAVSPQGSSVLTPRIMFTTEDNTIAYASTAGGSNAGVGVGVALLVIVIIVGAVGAIWVFRNKRFGTKPPGAVAFENPSYIRETNPDGMIINGGPESLANGNGSTVPSVSNGLSSSNNSNGYAWNSETLHSPRVETEVAPTLYEELRLGSEGAGFRRLR